MHPPPMEMNPETEFNVKEDYDLLENGYVLSLYPLDIDKLRNLDWRD